MPFVSSGHSLNVGVGQQYATLAAAVAASKPGDTIYMKAGLYKNDYVTIKHDLRIVGVDGQTHLQNTNATIPNGKGIMVVTKDADVVVENLEFSGAKVADHNGSGIRFDSGTLEVKNSYFHHNENGILTGQAAAATLKIDGSEFGHNGYGDGYTHGIYVGHIASVSVTNSYFHDTKVGHHIKSRAAATTITDNKIMDGDGNASYDIDVPQGGKTVITGNIIEQSAASTNRAMIAYGAEAAKKGLNAGSSLLVEDNQFISHGGKATGVMNKTAITAQVENNDFHQVSTPVSGPNKQVGNLTHADLSDVVLVKASSDFYLDDPEFTLFANGVKVGGSNVVTADRAQGEWETFAFTGNWGDNGPTKLEIQYTNDTGSGTANRNLHIDWIEVDGRRNEPSESTYDRVTGVDLAGQEKMDFAGKMIFDSADLIA